MRGNFFQATKNNHVEFYFEGPEYYEHFLSLIQSAKKSIHLQTYIFENDLFGQRVQEELKNSALRGVRVYLLVDSVGSMMFPTEASNQLIEAGVLFTKFNGIQFKWLYQWGRRLHHKILLIDHAKASVGGINVISKSFSQDFPTQLDFAVYLEGPVTFGLSRYCQLIFRRSFEKYVAFEPLRIQDCIPHPNGQELKVSINDWVFRRWQITRQYSRLAKVAKNEITIINSYFFPRRKFMRQLVVAARRGVRVRLILPKFSDWHIYVPATQYLYSYFLKHNIEIYEWKKSILHGKLATIDGQWSTVGSFNLNYTSYQQNLEMNIDIQSAEVTKLINDRIEEVVLAGCEKIEAKEFFENCGVRTKVFRFLSYLVLALIANFSIGLHFQEGDGKYKGRLYNVMRITASIILLILGIIGSIVPVMPGIPFLIISFLLVYRQIVSNNRNV